MSEQDARLDARMRGLFADVDTHRDFDVRVMQRIATLDSAPAADLHAQFERQRDLRKRELLELGQREHGAQVWWQLGQRQIQQP